VEKGGRRRVRIRQRLLSDEIDETAYNRIFADLDISQMDDTSCFSESGKCFSKDEMLTYLNAEATVEAAS